MDETNTVLKEDIDSSDDEVDEESLIADLKGKLSSSDSEAYLNLIATLRKFGRLQELREFRKKYDELFGCAPNMWQQWLQDEMELVTSNGDKREILSLYRSATDGFYSFELYLQRIQFEYEMLKNKVIDVHEFRRSVDLSLAIAGSDINCGSKLWKLARTMCKSEAETQRLADIKKLYFRQFEVPLQNSEEALLEFEKWGKGHPGVVEVDDIAEGRKIHSVALRKRYTREDWEIKLLAQENTDAGMDEIATSLLEYIEFEMKEFDHEVTDSDKSSSDNSHAVDNRNPYPLICLFERAISKVSSSADIFLLYASFLDSLNSWYHSTNPLYFDLNQWRLRVHRLATKRIKFSAKLYIGWIYSMERLHTLGKQQMDNVCSLADIETVVRNSMNSRMQNAMDYVNILLCYCGIVKRLTNDIEAVRKACAYSSSVILKLFPTWTSGRCQFYKYQASVEIALHDDVRKARELWELILEDPQFKGSYNMWKNYIDLERTFKNYDKCRLLFGRAVENVTDYAGMILNEWENFEREVCTDVFILDRSNYRIHYERTKLQKRAAELQVARGQLERKRKFEEIVQMQDKKKSSSARSKKKLATKKIKKQRSSVGSQEKSGELQNGYKKYKIPSTTLFTLYVCNISPDADKESFAKVFESIDGYRESRLVMQKNDNACKGFAYVDFKHNEGVMEGLKLDGTVYFNQPLKVRTYKKKDFPSQAIFVSNIPTSVNLTLLGKKFKEYGTIIGIDFLKGSKGTEASLRAIIEFADTTSAKAAMKYHNKLTFDGTEKCLSITKSKRPVSESGKAKWMKSVKQNISIAPSKLKRKPRLGLFRPRSVVTSK